MLLRGLGFALMTSIISPAFADDIQSLKKVVAMQQAQLNAVIPAGTIIAFGGASPPSGWKLCDGSVLTLREYPGLYQAIGNAWGSPGEGKFNLPDLRGRFLRGVDAGANRDEERNKRLESSPGGNTGDKVGSVQNDATAVNSLRNATSSVSGRIYGGAHKHDYNGTGAHPWNGLGSTATNGHIIQNINTNAFLDASVSKSGSDHSHDFELKADPQALTGDLETRPVNANVQYIIKY